jgi:hypothetical protein
LRKNTKGSKQDRQNRLRTSGGRRTLILLILTSQKIGKPILLPIKIVSLGANKAKDINRIAKTG